MIVMKILIWGGGREGPGVCLARRHVRLLRHPVQGHQNHESDLTSLMWIQLKEFLLHRQPTCWRRPEQRGWLVSFLCSGFALNPLLNISNWLVFFLWGIHFVQILCWTCFNISNWWVFFGGSILFRFCVKHTFKYFNFIYRHRHTRRSFWLSSSGFNSVGKLHLPNHDQNATLPKYSGLVGHYGSFCPQRVTDTEGLELLVVTNTIPQVSHTIMATLQYEDYW